MQFFPTHHHWGPDGQQNTGKPGSTLLFYWLSRHKKVTEKMLILSIQHKNKFVAVTLGISQKFEEVFFQDLKTIIWISKKLLKSLTKSDLSFGYFTFILLININKGINQYSCEIILNWLLNMYKHITAYDLSTYISIFSKFYIMNTITSAICKLFFKKDSLWQKPKKWLVHIKFMAFFKKTF